MQWWQTTLSIQSLLKDNLQLCTVVRSWYGYFSIKIKKRLSIGHSFLNKDKEKVIIRYGCLVLGTRPAAKFEKVIDTIINAQRPKHMCAYQKKSAWPALISTQLLILEPDSFAICSFCYKNRIIDTQQFQGFRNIPTCLGNELSNRLNCSWGLL